MKLEFFKFPHVAEIAGRREALARRKQEVNLGELWGLLLWVLDDTPRGCCENLCNTKECINKAKFCRKKEEALPCIYPIQYLKDPTFLSTTFHNMQDMIILTINITACRFHLEVKLHYK
jgi:hypothetical protein